MAVFVVCVCWKRERGDNSICSGHYCSPMDCMDTIRPIMELVTQHSTQKEVLTSPLATKTAVVDLEVKMRRGGRREEDKISSNQSVCSVFLYVQEMCVSEFFMFPVLLDAESWNGWMW